ncbi:MAG: hypothetical protein E5X23_09295 [Mesorhizobium sp.]|uniref:hypothetical protein n=1 Tax=unclassified Mesorhizobium TaxID=325217 RepID=UPI000FCAF460|nr:MULTISPECIES: hypothetical protein [unclassified Mesorhizobium]TGV93665.1 hypothetical protein EN801_011550 [Mesorhizobium sp. M00.F.Ca.ET.158.01.1.1]MCT2577679.1 hypothetical protein [Mesorhizobium sp. P13.3]MDF3166617.1 hypothetical protein [Mesorhizobium sp. P16.1]MDF3179379.1 hypothetical protein [Mesorhizobium sp. P17.1]MDF3183271.1 hypothetical protein [Mesorhizobium sp. ICCV3110.1]
MRRQETHDETIARIWQEMEAKRLADLEAQYAPRVKPESTKPTWTRRQDGTDEMSIPARAGARMIHGLASSSSINSHGYALISRGMDCHLPVALLSSHKGHSAPIGEVFYVRRTEDRIYVRAQINDNEAGDFAWTMIRSGELRCFSGAARNSSLRLQGIVEGKTFYGAWELLEVSICPTGANPDSVFEVYQSSSNETKFFSRPIADKSGKALVKHAEPELPYAGVWAESEQYERGQFTTAGGALWHAEAASKGIKPGTAPAIWRLAVKRGEADRLERQHASTRV